jgi:hypothetical protein
MNPLPLPSHVHYELLLQVLEQQSAFAATQNARAQEHVNQIIANLRKALSQQKQLESLCNQLHIPVDHRWSTTERSP